jgi:hypothetical protein
VSKFHSNYIKLLRRQVDEEIEYLVANAHDDGNNIPCMFCQPVGVKGQLPYRCARLKTLREFQSQIVHEEYKLRQVDQLEKSSRFTSVNPVEVMPLNYPF